MGADVVGSKDLMGLTEGTYSLRKGAAPYEAVGTYDVGVVTTCALCLGDSTAGVDEDMIIGCDAVITGDEVLVTTGCDVIILSFRFVAMIIG